MGCSVREWYVTNTGDESGMILMSHWIPEKKDDGYYMPKDTALGYDIWVPNVLDLKEEEGSVKVNIVKSDMPTGLWLICPDQCYFGDEQHLYNAEVRYKEGTKHFDSTFYDKIQENNEYADPFGLHVDTDIEMHEGDGPYYVTLVREPKWKTIECWPKYSVCENGEVRRDKDNKILKQYPQKSGYSYVWLNRGFGYKALPVHRLVAEAFIPNPENKPFVDHIDTNRGNNVLSNLRWATEAENSNNPITLENMSKATFREILTRLLYEDAGYYHPEEDGITDDWIEELSEADDIDLTGKKEDYE